MVFLITYDIPDDKVRFKTSKLLESMGERVQESVFECRFPPDKVIQVSKELAKLIETGGNIRIYPLHRECYDSSIGIGDYTKTIAAQGFGIF